MPILGLAQINEPSVSVDGGDVVLSNERRRRSGLGPLRHCSSATTNVESASADVAAASRCSALRNCAASELISWGSTGDRARVRAFISAICRRRHRGARARSSRLPTGLGATHGAQRAGSSCAHAAKSS